MIIESFPIVIGLELTLECNLRCRHCASSAGISREDELTLNEMLNICDQFPALLVQEVDFTGGEPLLHPNWREIALHLQKLNIPVRMVTNGLLLKENVPALADAGIQTVGISIDGLEENHDRIRKHQGLFKKIMAGVEAAQKADIPVAAITAVHEQNIGELPRILELLRKSGIRQWQVQPTFSLGRARKENLDISDETFIRLGNFLRNNISCSDRLNIAPADGVGYFTKIDSRKREWNGCGAGISSCGITSNGKVKGCLSMPNHLIEGDLRKQDLWNIWFDENSFKYNRQFTPDDLGYACKGCPNGKKCKGGCSVMSYSSSGQFHNDPYCFYSILERRESSSVFR